MRHTPNYTRGQSGAAVPLVSSRDSTNTREADTALGAQITSAYIITLCICIVFLGAWPVFYRGADVGAFVDVT